MERRRLTDILPANKAMVIYYLATSRRRSILVFRLPLAFCKSCSLKRELSGFSFAEARQFVFRLPHLLFYPACDIRETRQPRAAPAYRANQ